MLRSLYTAGTGMVAQQQNLDVISNNLANVNTTGFRGQRAEFQDLMYQTMRNATKGDGAALGTPEGIQFGLGTKISATASIFNQGSAQQTNDPLNVCIQGNGFFKVVGADGKPVYTRDGTFKANADGKVVTSDGLSLDPELTIPQGATAVSVGDDGTVVAIKLGETSATEIGKITLTRFSNPGGLHRLGGNLFAESDASGSPVDGAPNADGQTKLLGGYIETSNVQVVDEMTKMITAQRAYEINSKAIQTADDMLATVTNLKR